MTPRTTVVPILLSITLFAVSCSQEVASVDPDLEESVQWYTGVSGRVDNDRARELLTRAAADGDPISRMWIARVYSTGRMGFEENIDSARAIATQVIDAVENAAAHEVPEALFLMGTAYAEGLGKTRDDAVAVEWYKRAADHGNVLAQHNLGNVHFSGTGVPQNDSLAVFWWTKAAEQGDAIPQLRLGTMFEEGRGVDRDLEEARAWYQRAADRGNTDAAEALARLGG